MSKSKQISPAGSDLPIVKVSFNPEALTQLKERALAELEGVQGIEIPDDETAKLAAGALVSIAAVKKDAAAQSKAWLEPLKAETQRIRAPFKLIEDTCDAARVLVDRALGAYELAKAKAQRAAQLEATKAVVADNTPALTQALQTVSANAATKLQGVTVKAFWVATVRAPDLVPYEFLTPDLTKIGRHASAFSPDQEPTPIPGVTFTLETSTTARQPR